MSQHDDYAGRIAVIGMAGRFPGAPDVDQYWDLIAAGRESVRFFGADEVAALGVPEEVRNHPAYVPAAAVLDEAACFDAALFGMTPVEAQALDPQQRVLLECAAAALDDAGHAPAAGARVGVFVGVTRNGYLVHHLLQSPDFLRGISPLQMIIASDKSFAATQISYKLDLQGPSMVVDTACSTALVAIHQACQSLLQYECDMALAGGSSIAMPSQTGHVYQPGGIFSEDGHCRPFDERARGTVRGSGAGVVVLKRLEDALADGDCIDAVILASAINNDGAGKVGFTAPSVTGQASVIETAHAIAGIDPRTIGLVEAHGTGTPLGDPIEVAALSAAFRASTDATQFCAIGSVKANIGHLDAAAGVAGLIKAVLALRHRQLPPTPHFTRPNPEIGMERTPFVVNTELRPWPEQDWPRRAAVSAFGIGGTNAHVLLEEAPAVAAVDAARGPWLLPLSAASSNALERTRQRLQAALATMPEEASLARVAATLQRGRRRFRFRAACVAATAGEGARALDRMALGGSAAHASDEERPLLVFLFPGQGTQSLGMARAFYRSCPGFAALVDHCAQILRPMLDCDVRHLLVDADQDDPRAKALLAQTRVAQPALFVVEYALARTLQEAGVHPDLLLGHSLGELAAATVAGVFGLEQALGVVAERGRLMQQTAAGAMLAVALSADELHAYLDGGCELAACNAPGQTVVAGAEQSIAALAARLGEAGITVRRLASERAFHSAAMDPVLPEFERFVDRVDRAVPTIPVFSNVSGSLLTNAQATAPEYWARQIRSTVRFSQALAGLTPRRTYVFIELGPGRVLSNCVRSHEWAAEPACVPCLDDAIQESSAPLHQVLAALWTGGVSPDWTAIDPLPAARTHLPAYPFERQSHWVDPAPAAHQAPPRSPAGALLYEPSWRRTGPAPASNAPRGSTLWCVAEQGGQVAAHLAARHERVYRLNGNACDDYAGVLAKLPLSGVERIRIVHWLPCAHGAAAAVAPLLQLARAVASLPEGVHVDLAWVTNGVCDLTGTEPLNPDHALAHPMCTVIAQELPFVRTVCIDIEACSEHDQAASAMLVRAELEGALDQPLVALRSGRRWIPQYLPLEVASKHDTPLHAGGVYLITGGMGRIGVALAAHLAGHYGAKVALLGRRVPAQLDGPLAALCTRVPDAVRLYGADVADAGAMRAVIAEVERDLGPLTGVFHAAAETAPDSFAAATDLDRDRLLTHCRAKVDGTLVLADLLAERELAFCVLFSSLSTVVGGIGFAGYAAANAYLDALAEQFGRSPRSTRWVSIAFDAWAAAAGAEARGTQLAAPAAALAEQAGIAALCQVLEASRGARVLVTASALDATRRGAQTPAAMPVAAAQPRKGERPDLSVPYSPASDDLEALLVEMWEALLGISGIGVHDPFMELGGHSLSAMQLMARLRKEFELAVPLHVFFRTPTVAGLANHIAEVALASDSDAQSISD